MPVVTTRPVSEPQDTPLLFQLYATTRADEVSAISNITEAQKWEFLALQYKAREQHYAMTYPHAYRYVVTCDGEFAGGIWVDWSEKKLHILDLAFLPQYQNQGLATQLLDQFTLEADHRDFITEIATHTENLGAQRLYERFGFIVLERSGTHVFYRREPVVRRI